MGPKALGLLGVGLLLATASYASATGCSSFAGEDPGQDAAAEAPDAGMQADGAADDGRADTGTPTDAGCINVIVNPGFEGATTCAPWKNYGGAALPGTPALGGAKACSACSGI